MGLYHRNDLDLVQVREYCGIEDGKHAWIFLGYDFVLHTDEETAISVMSSEENNYTYLPYAKNGCFDHSNLKAGDIRIVCELNGDMIFQNFLVSNEEIDDWVSRNGKYSFVHGKKREKVKKIGLQ